MLSVYSVEESKERLRFTMFLQQYFRLKSKGTSTFKYPLDSDFLFALYYKLNPDTILCGADLEVYFSILGVYNTNQIYIDLIARHASEVPPSMLLALQPHMTIAAIQALNAIGITKSVDESQNSFIAFINLFVKTTHKGEKTTLSDMYQLYTLYSLNNGISPISTKRMAEIIRAQISPIKKGYVNGASGRNYAICTIPTEERWQHSLTLGIGIFEYMGKLFDNRGKHLAIDYVTCIPKDDVTKLYIANRATKRSWNYGEEIESSSTESTSTNEEYPENEVNDGRTPKSPEENVVGSPEKSETKIPPANNNRNTGDVSDNTNVGSPKIPRSRNTETARSDDADTTRSRDVRLRTDEAEMDGDTFDDCEDEPGTDEIEKPSKKEIFAALRITYNINPKTFDKRTMNSFLVSMNVDYSAEDLWDEFMTELKK